MTQLSVNLNKVALLRNSRGRNYPDVVQVAKDCIAFGADGITMHPRPDERHARKSDIFALKEALDVELNVEGYPSEDFLKMIEEVQPAQCTLVPDAPDQLTSDHGWDTQKYKQMLMDIIRRIQEAGVRASIFVDPDLDAIDGAREIGTDRIELYTETYASQYEQGKPQAVEPFARSAAYAHEIGLQINAGHDLNLENLQHFYNMVQPLEEVSIGHALVTDALYFGLEETIQRYQACLGKSVPQVK